MLTDIYVLAPERSVEVVGDFLNHFLPEREKAAEDYRAPEYSDSPDVVFSLPEEVIAYCCAHPQAPSRIYWRNRSEGGNPQSAHIFFLHDGGLVLGLSVPDRRERERERWLGEMRTVAGATFGYITGECPPEDTTAEFIAVAGRAE